jgi:hypothetical protein
VICNKIDLCNNTSFDLCKGLNNNINFFYTSAKTGDNVYETFDFIIKKVYNSGGYHKIPK